MKLLLFLLAQQQQLMAKLNVPRTSLRDKDTRYTSRRNKLSWHLKQSIKCGTSPQHVSWRKNRSSSQRANQILWYRLVVPKYRQCSAKHAQSVSYQPLRRNVSPATLRTRVQPTVSPQTLSQRTVSRSTRTTLPVAPSAAQGVSDRRPFLRRSARVSSLPSVPRAPTVGA